MTSPATPRATHLRPALQDYGGQAAGVISYLQPAAKSPEETLALLLQHYIYDPQKLMEGSSQRIVLHDDRSDFIATC